MPNLLAMTAPHSPTVRARRLGSYLQQLREKHGLSAATVGARIGKHQSTVLRIEQAKTKPDAEIIERLLGVYGVDEAPKLALLKLAEDAWARGWWQEYGDVLEDTFACLEDEASGIYSWQPQLIPGLLQTEDYALALTSAGSSAPPREEIEQRVDARARRRKVLRRDPRPHLHAVLGETALRQAVGGAEVMRDQLRYLREAGERENVTVQVLPFAGGAHPGMSGPFVIFEFEHEDDPAVAYTENLSGSAYLESETALARFRLAWGDVLNVALSPDESADMISALIDER